MRSDELPATVLTYGRAESASAARERKGGRNVVRREMPTDDLRVRLADATSDVELAQHEVERAMNDLTVDLPRAHKTLISDTLRRAFDKLAEARTKLEALSEKP